MKKPFSFSLSLSLSGELLVFQGRGSTSKYSPILLYFRLRGHAEGNSNEVKEIKVLKKKKGERKMVFNMAAPPSLF